jgi:hypothetical protein
MLLITVFNALILEPSGRHIAKLRKISMLVLAGAVALAVKRESGVVFMATQASPPELPPQRSNSRVKIIFHALAYATTEV